MKRAKGYLNLHCRKFLFNALMKPIFEYCCSVWGNAPNDQLLRLLRVQKRCGRLILDARLLENCAQKFQKLKWLPIDGIIRIKKLCMMFKIVNKECPLDCLLIMPWLYQNAGLTRVCEHFMRVRLAFGIV